MISDQTIPLSAAPHASALHSAEEPHERETRIVAPALPISSSPSAICHLPSAISFTVPPNDHAFAALPVKVCHEVHSLLKRLSRIHVSGNYKRECNRISATLKAAGNGGRGTSGGTLLRLYYAYTRYGKQVGDLTYSPGDWRCIVDWSKAGPRSKLGVHALACPALPAEFIQFWKTLCENHQRVTSEAHRELLQIWRTGFTLKGKQIKQIPGYEVPLTGLPTDPLTGLPFGWTLRNLSRSAPDRYELTAARIGIQSASQVGLKIRTNRVGLKVLEQIQFDDHEFNVKVNFPGQLQSWRPRSFGAADVLASCCFAFVAKPTFWDAENEKKKVLTETDFMWFVVHVLTHHGYRTDRSPSSSSSSSSSPSTTFIVEHGTAAIRDEFAQRIADATGGHVRIGRSGRFHTPAHQGQFAPPSGGNFRFKNVIECYWRMLDDRMDSFPGQAGLDRNHAPEEMERADAYNTMLLKAAAGLRTQDSGLRTPLTPERAAQLIIPRLDWPEFTRHAHAAVARINAEFNHEIQGWEKCGFLIKEFRQSPAALEWNPIGPISPISPIPDDCFRVRKLSRFEAYRREYTRDLAAGAITRLAPEMIPALVGPRHALKCNGAPTFPVRGGVIEIDDWRIDSDPIAYVALDRDGQPLREGDRYVCYVNPVAPDCLIACDQDHRVVAVLQPQPVPAKNDQPAIEKSMGQQNQWRARKLAPMRDRHAPDEAAVKFMRQHNQTILDGGQTEADQQRAKQLRRANLAAETLLDSEPQRGSIIPAQGCDTQPSCVATLGSDPDHDRNPEGVASFDPADLL